MPELAEPPTKETINPSLAALFDIKVPDEAPPAEADAVEELATETATPPAKPAVVPEVVPVVPAADTKKSDITLRLAPDFAAAAAKPEPPKADDSEITDEIIAAQKTPKAQADMRKFRAANDALKKELETLRLRPAAIPEDTTELKTRLGQLEEENRQYLERIEKANLWDSPKFQKEFVQPRDQKYQDAASVLKESGGDPASLGRAMGLTGKARIDVLDEIREQIPSEMMKGRFDRLIEGIDNDNRIINEKLRNAKQAVAESKIDETARKQAEYQETVKKLDLLLSSARRDISENVMPELYQKVDNPDFAWWNETIERDAKVAREILLEATPEKAVYAAEFASRFGTVLEMWRNERKARLATEEENRELKGSSPTLGTDRKPPKDAGEGVEPEDIVARLRSGHYK